MKNVSLLLIGYTYKSAYPGRLSNTKIFGSILSLRRLNKYC